MTPVYDMRLGDCLDPATGMASLADKSVDHVITDPPYEAEAHTLQRRTKSTFVGSATSGDAGGLLPKVKAIDFEAITADVRDASAVEFTRVSRRWLLAFCQAEAVGAWRDSFVAAGAKWKRSCIWLKPDGQPQLTGDRPGMGYESIACAHADTGRSQWNGGGKHGVYKFLRQQPEDSSGVVFIHPTRKPDALMLALIRDFTDPGDLILDPFAGSGSTGVAAIRLGRRFIGFEKDPKYHAVACKRLAAAREQLELCA